MHPMVKPALRRGWRDLNTVQFGMTPAHAMTLRPVDTASGSFLDLLDGTRGLPLLRVEGRRMDLPEGGVDALVGYLARAGLLDDARGGGPAAEALRADATVLGRLGPDLASLSLTTSAPGEAIGMLAARRSLRVRVLGAGRVGTLLASLLSAAGVGGVEVRDVGRVAPGDVGPGGLSPDAVGESRQEAARRAVGDAAPERARRGRPRPPLEDSGGGLSLVVLAPRDDAAVHAPLPAAAESLMASGTPHLYAGVAEGSAVVGPLVLPGGSGCAGCLHQARTDHDPAWPRLVAQWHSGRARRTPAACDVTLAATVAGLAAAHALAFLDGRTPSSTGARWVAALPSLRWQARPVRGHPDCPCGAAAYEGCGTAEGADPRGENVGEDNGGEDGGGEGVPERGGAGDGGRGSAGGGGRGSAGGGGRGGAGGGGRGGAGGGGRGGGDGTGGEGNEEHTSESGVRHETMAVRRSSVQSGRTPGAARPVVTWRAHV